MPIGNAAQLAIILKLIDKATPGLKKAQKETLTLSQKMTNVGKSLTKNVTLPLVAIGAAGVKMAADLDKSMRDIQSLGGRTDAQIKTLSKSFVSMSTDINQTVDSANNLAKAYYDVASAGYEGEEAMTVLRASTKAATAGLTDTKTAVSILTGVLKSYNKDASEAADISDLLFTTVQRGKTTFGELAAAMPEVLPLAAALGVEFKELTAAMTTMSNQSINAAHGSTYLRALMNELVNPSEQLIKAFQDMGYESGRAALEALGLAGTMQKLDEYTRKANIPMDELFNNVRADLGALALTGNQMENFTGHLEAMGQAAGATNAAYAEQIKSFDAQWKSFKNTANAILITLGNALLPTIIEIMQALKGIINVFLELPEPVQKTVVLFLTFAAAVGPILVIAAKLKGAFLALKVILIALAGPWAAVVALGVALGAALYEIGRALNIGDKIKGFLDAFMRGLPIAWERMKKFVSSIPGELLRIFKNLIKSLLGEGIAKAIEDGFDWIGKQVDRGIDWLKKHSFGILSPSRVGTDIGTNFGEAIVQGIGASFAAGMNTVGTRMAGAMNELNMNAQRAANQTVANINAQLNRNWGAYQQSGGGGFAGVNMARIGLNRFGGRAGGDAGSYSSSTRRATQSSLMDKFLEYLKLGEYVGSLGKALGIAEDSAFVAENINRSGRLYGPGWGGGIPRSQASGGNTYINIGQALGTPRDLADQLSRYQGGQLSQRGVRK